MQSMPPNSPLADIQESLAVADRLDRAARQYDSKVNRQKSLTPLKAHEYWQLVFAYALNDEERRYAFCDGDGLRRYIAGIEQAPDYLSAQSERIFGADRFTLCGGRRQKEILRVLEHFYRLKIKLYDGTFFKALRAKPETTLCGIIHDHDETRWVCAQMLADSGVNIISNRRAAYGFAKMHKTPAIKTYRGWLQFLAESTESFDVTHDHRKIDFYSRLLSFPKPPVPATFPTLRRVTEDGIADRRRNDMQGKMLLPGDDTLEYGKLIRYICSVLSPDIYDELILHEPTLLPSLSQHAKTGFKHIVATRLNGGLISLLKACSCLSNFSPEATQDEWVTDHRTLYDVIAEDIRTDKRENCALVVTDTKHRVIYKSRIGIGTLNSVNFDPRLIFGPALQLNAAAVALAHNHPSGDPEPSDLDVSLTEKLYDIAKLLGFCMLDHLIIGHDAYYSMHEKCFFDAPASTGPHKK